MPLSEFEIINHYFNKDRSINSSVITGIGDDAAIVKIPEGNQLAISTDTLVSGIHFPISTEPYDIGYKALAVNISDMAAMGAQPLYATMSITLESSDPDWLHAFSQGFFNIADKYSIDLIGGDVSRGPLSISVQIMGVIPDGEASLRSGARPGDMIYVSGELGMGAFALFSLGQVHEGIDKECLNKLNRPEPRLETGIALRNLSSACIDISDGLNADLSHILSASSVGAEVEIHKVPMFRKLNDLHPRLAINLGLNTGDDYELCFTIQEKYEEELNVISKKLPVKLTKIGKVTDSGYLNWLDENGKAIDMPVRGHRHF
ncbi:MAG: thiamine-phosphate kinase [Gammaproteobacteria bacterium]|nr:thiamine-phosphate kinase [Gammaproteobacteria bacterium]